MRLHSLRLLLLIIASFVALGCINFSSGNAVYFICIGVFIVTTALLYLIGVGPTPRGPLFAISAVTALYIAGQFDADGARIGGSLVIAVLALYILVVTVRRIRRNR